MSSNYRKILISGPWICRHYPTHTAEIIRHWKDTDGDWQRTRRQSRIELRKRKPKGMPMFVWLVIVCRLIEAVLRWLEKNR